MQSHVLEVHPGNRHTSVLPIIEGYLRTYNELQVKLDRPSNKKPVLQTLLLGTCYHYE